jgi:hypothetical protein
MDLAQRNFSKYQSEYRATTEDNVLHSPVSTALEIYSVFPREDSSIARDLNYVFNHVPHMRKLWPKEYQAETDFLPAIMKAPPYLTLAFPDRQPEARPSTVYYSMEGDRKEILISSRSSRGAGLDFEVPPEDRKGKGRAKEASEEDLPTEELRDEATPEVLPSTERSASHWDMSNASHGILGSEIPYKDPVNFFVPKSLRFDSRFTTVPGPDLPNPIFGMATSESYGGGESISQARRPPLRRDPSQPVLSRVDEVDEETFHSRFTGRDAPPHMPQGS